MSPLPAASVPGVRTRSTPFLFRRRVLCREWTERNPLTQPAGKRAVPGLRLRPANPRGTAARLSRGTGRAFAGTLRGGGARLRNEHARFRAWRARVRPARSPAAGFALGALVASHQDPQPAIPILVLRPTRTPELRTAASHRPAWWQRGEGRQVPLAWTTGPGPWGWVPLRVGGAAPPRATAPAGLPERPSARALSPAW